MVPEEFPEAPGEFGGGEVDVLGEIGEGEEGILGNVLGEGVGQGSGSVEIIDERLLSFFDGVWPVLGRDVGEAWKLGLGAEMAGQNCGDGFGNGHFLCFLPQFLRVRGR